MLKWIYSKFRTTLFDNDKKVLFFMNRPSKTHKEGIIYIKGQHIKLNSKALNGRKQEAINFYKEYLWFNSLSDDEKVIVKINKSYKKIKRYDLDEILSIIDSCSFTLLENYKVKVNSIRLQTFKYKGIVCSKCGIRGKYFWLERLGNDNPHLNLYAVNKNGIEVLMTKDHRIPKSKGGTEDLENMDTMCCLCNNKKGNTI